MLKGIATKRGNPRRTRRGDNSHKEAQRGTKRGMRMVSITQLNRKEREEREGGAKGLFLIPVRSCVSLYSALDNPGTGTYIEYR